MLARTKFFSLHELCDLRRSIEDDRRPRLAVSTSSSQCNLQRESRYFVATRQDGTETPRNLTLPLFFSCTRLRRGSTPRESRSRFSLYLACHF